MKEQKKAMVIYHSKDMDGFCSGAICRMALEKQGYEVSMEGYDYSDPDFVAHNQDLVVMVDVSMSMSVMREYDKYYGHRFIFIDHHVSFNDQIMDHYNNLSMKIVYDVNLSASELAWNYFFPDEEMPLMVYAVGTWDIHRKMIDPFVAEKHGFSTFDKFQLIHFGTSIYMGDPCEDKCFSHWQAAFADTEFVYNHYGDGKVVELVKKREGAFQAASVAYADIEYVHSKYGKKLLACNLINGKPNKYVALENSFPLVFFWYEGSKDIWIYSLRQNEYAINKSVAKPAPILEVAKSFGGGGHINACGFSTSDLIK